MINALLLLSLVAAQALSIIDAALAGDRRATRTLLGHIGPVIQRRVRAMLRRSFSAIQQEDLVQEVWSTLLANDGRLLRAYDGERPLQAYVGVIARRAAKDVVRNASAQKRGGGQIHDELPADELLGGCGVTPGDAVEARDLLDRLVEHLDAHFKGRGQLVMRCLYTDGRSVEETAELLGMTRNAAAIWQTKIRKVARVWLEAQAH